MTRVVLDHHGRRVRPHARWIAVAALCAGCSDPRARVLTVSLHELQDCPISSERVALDALGDFPTSERTVESLPLDAEGRDLGLPLATRALGAGSDTHWGVGPVTSDGASLTVLPRDRSCRLAVDAAPGGSYPLATGGESLGVSATAGAALIVGAALDAAAASSALAIRLDDLTTRNVPGGLPWGVAHATVTPFGRDGLLVAGGDNPIGRGDPALAVPLDRAVVYDARAGTFDRAAPLLLSQGRTRHAAVVLRGGETLLLAGAGQDGVVSARLEAISPDSRSVRVVGLATLSLPRAEPRVAALSDGAWLVAGGVDAEGDTVGTLEWLSPDADRLLRVLPARFAHAHAVAPLGGGGALLVGGCVSTTSGCTARTEGELATSVSWLGPGEEVHELVSLDVAPNRAELVTTSDGARLLFTDRGVLRFDPWEREFAVAALDAADPVPGSVTHLDSGTLLWLTRESPAAAATPRVARLDVRDGWVRDVEPLGLSSPRHLEPDRAPLGVSSTGLEWGPSAGLRLGFTASVRVADATYRDFDALIDLGAGDPPRVAIAGTLLGDARCPWPRASAAGLRVERRGIAVTLVRGEARTRCQVPGARSALTLLAPDGHASEIRSVTVRRVAVE